MTKALEKLKKIYEDILMLVKGDCEWHISFVSISRRNLIH